MLSLLNVFFNSNVCFAIFVQVTSNDSIAGNGRLMVLQCFLIQFQNLKHVLIKVLEKLNQLLHSNRIIVLKRG